MLKKLSPQHKLFAKEYVACGFNASQAYRNVYGTNNSSLASRLVREPLIAELIDQEMKARCDELHINEHKILQKLNEMAFADPDDEYYGPSVQLKALDMLQKQLGLQKQNIKADVDTTTTIKVTIDDE